MVHAQPNATHIRIARCSSNIYGGRQNHERQTAYSAAYRRRAPARRDGGRGQPPHPHAYPGSHHRARHLLPLGVYPGAGVRARPAELPDRPVRAPQRLHRLRHAAAERRAHHARALRQLRLQPGLRRQDALSGLRPDARLARAHRARHRGEHAPAANRRGAAAGRPAARTGHGEVADGEGDHQCPRRQGPPHAAGPVHGGRRAAVPGRVLRRRALRPPRRGSLAAGGEPEQPPLPLPVPGGSVQLLPAPRRALRRGAARAVRLRRFLQGTGRRRRDLARGAPRHRRLLRHDRVGGPPVRPRDQPSWRNSTCSTTS